MNDNPKRDKMKNKKIITQLAGFALLGLVSGCATTATDKRDPLEGWNRGVQTFNDNLDTYAMKPLAQGYQWIMPEFADQGVTNFFSNIEDIVVTINDLLQFKIVQSGQDGARFIVNTVAGVGGFIDVAEMIELPKHKEDFDQTLGVWGLPMGPYLVLPFFGPSSPRGVGGLIGDAAMNPITYIGFGVFPGIDNGLGSAISGGAFALNAIDLRADNLSTEKIAREAAIDRYEFLKSAYFQQRKYLMYDGNVPEEEDGFDIDKELDTNHMGPINPY